MAETVIPAPPAVTVPVEGETGVFPVRRVLCVGRNYAAHRAEMGGDDREPPFFFAKPADALVPPGRDPAYPSATGNLHHEIELVIAIGKGGRRIAPADALGHIFGYAVGVDLTRRDLQNAAKDKGQPWDASKGFDDSAPISTIRRGSGAAPQGRISLTVNGQPRQGSTLEHMLWSVPEIVAEASKLWALEAGDLIFTGTPEGVGALVPGDRVEGEVEGVGRLAFTIAPAV